MDLEAPSIQILRSKENTQMSQASDSVGGEVSSCVDWNSGGFRKMEWARVKGIDSSRQTNLEWGHNDPTPLLGKAQLVKELVDY